MHLGALPPAFAGLANDDSQEASSFLEPFALEAGETLMEQGEEDLTLAFLVQGAVSFLHNGVRIGGGAARDMMGEVELFGQMPRTCTVTASAPTHLLVLAYEGWLELCERGNPAVYNIERFSHRRISDRLRAFAEGIAERAEGLPLPAPPKGGLMGKLTGMFGGRPGGSVNAMAALAQSPLFSWADPGILGQIAPGFKPERFAARTEICRQGELAEKAFLIVEGEADVLVSTGPASAEPIATLSAGSLFGDGSIAQHAPRISSVVARTELSALALSRQQYGVLFAADDPVGSVFRQALLKNLIAQLLAAQYRFVELERAAAERGEATLRGTPVSQVWRD
jgi:CRP-like cAMP-binding protein